MRAARIATILALFVRSARPGCSLGQENEGRYSHSLAFLRGFCKDRIFVFRFTLFVFRHVNEVYSCASPKFIRTVTEVPAPGCARTSSRPPAQATCSARP